MSAARLDKFVMFVCFITSAVNCLIVPVGFADHFVLAELVLSG